MERVGRAGAVVPLAIIVLFAVLDFAAGPGGVVLGLVVIAPLLAASMLGRRETASYAVLAFLVAVVLGYYDEQYTADTWPTQAARLFGVALGGLIAVAACSARLERERELRQLGTGMALAQEQARGAQDMAGLAEWLQRSLVTPPPPIADIEIAAAYVPAADHVKIGGDWYDAFPALGDRTLIVIGDVAGHDGAAAATMAQVRSVLRGIGQVLLAPPATLLTALDRAVRRLLEHDPDLLLGVDPDTRRVDHEYVLYPGDTVVLYTDGLVERRGAAIDDGLLRLRDIATAEAGLSVEKLCDAILTACSERPDDDIAVLALRARV